MSARRAGAPGGRAAGKAREGAAGIVIPNFRSDGQMMDLVRPCPADIVWHDIAARLSRIVRFNGAPRALSVAQHCVMGADALYRETGHAALAGHFVLHDAHEAILGDIARPVVDLIQWIVADMLSAARYAGNRADIVHRAVAAAKREIDTAIFFAARLPDLAGAPDMAARVRDMDDRMLRAEGLALFGERAAGHLPAAGLPPPRLTGALTPWGPAKAELAWLDRLQRYLGISARPYP